MSEEPVTPESPKAIAAPVIGETVVPRKVPAFDDIEGQTNSLVGALSSALLTVSADVPIGIPPPLIGSLAGILIGYGVRQTEHSDPAAQYGPTWVTDGVRAESVQLPDQPRHTEAEPYVARTDTAPECPVRIAEHERAVRR